MSVVTSTSLVLAGTVITWVIRCGRSSSQVSVRWTV
jgi:hypothetical protein